MRPFIVIILLICQLLHAEIYTVGTEKRHPPYNFIDDKNQVYGMDIDILSAIAEAENFELNYVISNRNTLLTQWENQGIHIIIDGISSTDIQNSLYLSSSNPYLYSQDCVFARSPEKLNNWQNGTILMQLSDNIINKLLSQKIVTDKTQFITNEPSPFLNLKKLATGSGDSMIGDCFSLKYLTQHGVLRALKFYSKPLEITADNDSSFLVIAVDNRVDGLLEKINRGLATIQSSGELSKIVDKWRE